jgi:hypothetical protein
MSPPDQLEDVAAGQLEDAAGQLEDAAAPGPRGRRREGRPHGKAREGPRGSLGATIVPRTGERGRGRGRKAREGAQALFFNAVT